MHKYISPYNGGIISVYKNKIVFVFIDTDDALVIGRNIFLYFKIYAQCSADTVYLIILHLKNIPSNLLSIQKIKIFHYARLISFRCHG